MTLKIRCYISIKGFPFYINLYPKEGRDEKGCVEIAHLGLQKEMDLPFGGFAPSVPEKIALVLTWVQGKEGFKRLKDIFTRQKAGGHGPVETSIFSLTI